MKYIGYVHLKGNTHSFQVEFDETHPLFDEEATEAQLMSFVKIDEKTKEKKEFFFNVGEILFIECVGKKTQEL